MYAICLRYCRDEYDAKEALQNGFINVFRHLENFSGKSPLYAWIRTIIIRASLDQLKLRKRNRSIISEDGIDSIMTFNNPEESMTLEAMMRIINSMPEGYKTIFNMYVIDDMSHLEISKMLGIAESTSRTQLLKARKYLQSKLKKGQNIYL